MLISILTDIFLYSPSGFYEGIFFKTLLKPTIHFVLKWRMHGITL